MRKRKVVLFLVVHFLSIITVLSPYAAEKPIAVKSSPMRRIQAATIEEPVWNIEVHKINKLWLTITNGGNFGLGPNSIIDPETGLQAPSCEYPGNSNIRYLYAAGFWAGAVVGRDTLVSVGADGSYVVQEFWANSGDEGIIHRRSSMESSTDYSTDAISEQDFICTYTDTFTDPNLTSIDSYDNRPHIPLGIKVDQRTYGWSYDYAEDFILFDFTIKNVNRFRLNQVYFGVYVDADVYHESNSGAAYMDDICGYLHSIPSSLTPCWEDTVRVAWTADNDGDPNPDNGEYTFSSSTSLTGTAVLRSPNPDMKYAFNWWIANLPNPSLDWGPRRIGTEERPFRDFGSVIGSPTGDRNKYYLLSSEGIDYDQLESAISHTSQGFLPPPFNADDYADGFDARYLFSFGPFDLDVGDTLPITIAYVGGEGFHKNGSAYSEDWDPFQPGAYQEQLDFFDLGENARWAHWIYDNPGYDTDGDGDSGLYLWECDIDDTILCFPMGEKRPPDSLMNYSKKIWLKGDGIPDFKGASPPTSPIVKVYPEFGRLRVRWNGQNSETDVDRFSGQYDFEGYRVYCGEGNREADYVLFASYDVEDYNIYTWDDLLRQWDLSESPFGIDTLRIMFENRLDPNLYDSPQRSYTFEGKDYYFKAQDWNQSDLSDHHGIYKVYPNANLNNQGDTTAAGFHRYYEYEYIIENLQASIPYYVSVTTFDYGSRKFDLTSLESAHSANEVMAYALASTDEVESKGLGVKVYPNPYRIDGGYAQAGYENRDRTKSAERSRAIHFYNLPSVCTIRIYTIDGDLVKAIEHNHPDGGPSAQHASWNMISRNTQAIVSGIYLYHVSSAMGEEIGKIVIIK